MTIGEVVKNYKKIAAKKTSGGSHPMNYFEPQHDDDSAYQTIRDRIESLSTVLELKQYLNRTSKSAVSKTFDKKISKSIMPLFTYFGAVFDPIYPFLEKSSPSESFIPSLLTLLTCCQAIYKNGEGIYRITNVSSDVYDFIGEQMHCMKNKMDTYDTEEQTRFIQHIEALPKVTPGLTDMPSTNPIRFFIVNENLTLPFKRKRSKTLYDATTTFFNEGAANNIYLVLSESMHCPMTTYEINYAAPDTINESPFIKKGEFFLDEVVTIKESILYTDSELALSIFIAFKDLLPN